ncbi:proton-conducting transporter membrane subunit [Alistipes indistinctus]|uniref:proton-conducting transporter transmembrane domain-containing protein n=1 Tax=Alistipes indistinctus TaxID=626932 RepID=UPI003AF086E3
MFIESVIALMLLSLAVFAVPVRWKWQVAFCVVGLGVLSALYEAVGVFSGGGRIYPEGINIVFGPQYGVTDPLSSFFLIILSLSAVAVLIYAKGYIKPYLGRKSSAQISLHYCGLGILYLSMLLVVTLRDGFSFLFAWEVMTLSSFVLMLFDAERREVRRAALSYLILMHVGFLFLLAGFVTLYASGLPASFDALALYGEQGGNIIPLFIVFLIGFGMKAGIFPLHVWLPEAHPAAPAHISAFMSGVMIKTGVYGVMRVVSCFDSHLFAIGLIVLCIGAVTGLWGVILAALQNDVKKLLAYSSIENIGIIFIALGTALLGKAEGSDPIFYAGMAGALLHTLNHSFFKSLLFMGAGNIYTATHTTSLDDLGGLGKRMPVTATLFLVGTLAICALPPLSGFVSEFLIYMGLLDGIAANGPVTVIALSGLIFLALIGGLAVLAFTKLYGVVFSGLPRSEVAERAREVSRPMLAAMALPLAGILLVGLAPVFALRWIVGLVARIADVSGASPISVPANVLDRTVSFSDSFLPLTYGIGMLVGISVILWLLRSWVVRRRAESSSPTWNCGFTAVTSRMQYTGESFSEGLGRISERMITNRLDPARIAADEIFPTEHHFDVRHKDTLDSLFARWWSYLLRRMNARLVMFRTGKVNHYVLYALLFLALVFLLSILNLL